MKEVARGSYRYWRDGIVQAVIEPWKLARESQGLVLTGQRLVNGRPVLNLEAHYQGSLCASLKLGWRARGRRLNVEYARVGTNLKWRLGEENTWRSFLLPADCLLFPLLRAVAGPLLRALAATPRPVVVPDIRDAAGGSFLHPLLSERRAVVAGNHYRYYGGEYGEAGADYWLDKRGLVLDYRWDSPQGGWEARLEDCWTAAEFEGFGPIAADAIVTPLAPQLL